MEQQLTDPLTGFAGCRIGFNLRSCPGSRNSPNVRQGRHGYVTEQCVTTRISPIGLNAAHRIR